MRAQRGIILAAVFGILAIGGAISSCGKKSSSSSTTPGGGTVNSGGTASTNTTAFPPANTNCGTQACVQ